MTHIEGAETLPKYIALPTCYNENDIGKTYLMN